jgi:hypothetical protein
VTLAATMTAIRAPGRAKTRTVPGLPAGTVRVLVQAGPSTAIRQPLGPGGRETSVMPARADARYIRQYVPVPGS